MPPAAQGGGEAQGPAAAPQPWWHSLARSLFLFWMMQNAISYFAPKPPVSPDREVTATDNNDGHDAYPLGSAAAGVELRNLKPSWDRGQYGMLAVWLTVGNGSEATNATVPSGVKLFLSGPRDAGRCAGVVRRFDPADMCGYHESSAAEQVAVENVVVKYTDSNDDGDFLFTSKCLWQKLHKAPVSARAVCARNTLDVRFAGLDLTESVAMNRSLFLEAQLSPVSPGPRARGVTRLSVPVTTFRTHRPEAKKLLLTAAPQSPKYAGLGTPATTTPDSDHDEVLTEMTEESREDALDNSVPPENSGKADVDVTISADEASSMNHTVRMYIHVNYTLNLLQVLSPTEQMPPPAQELFQKLRRGAAAIDPHYPEDEYPPPLYHQRFWQLARDYVEVNASNADTVGENFTVTVKGLGLFKYMMFVTFDESFRQQKEMGLMADEDTDMVKMIYLDNNPWYLLLCFAVSMLRMVFESLAFKNDVQFWRGKKNLRGLSLRAVAVNCYFQLVIFLFLLDDGNTSWTVTLPSGIGVAIEFWKLFKCCRVTTDEATGKRRIEWNVSDGDDTSEHDAQAMRYMAYFGIPCLIGYTGYSLLYEEHKGWYSFAIRTQVRFIYYAGFAMMCPQIYINYRLKSVAAMPWKSFVYKALNTVVDDLFAFIITMPLLHRLACFRDDLVFVILLYQRYIYRVDPKRVNEFGQRGDGGDPTEALDDAALLAARADEKPNGGDVRAADAVVESTKVIEEKTDHDPDDGEREENSTTLGEADQEEEEMEEEEEQEDEEETTEGDAMARPNETGSGPSQKDEEGLRKLQKNQKKKKKKTTTVAASPKVASTTQRSSDATSALDKEAPSPAAVDDTEDPSSGGKCISPRGAG